MKITLNKTETAAIVTLRLLSAARGKEVKALAQKRAELDAQIAAIHAEVDGQATELYASIAEDHGLDGIPLVHAFAKQRDGTSTLEWRDAPTAEKVAELRKQVMERADELLAAGMSPEQLAEIAASAPLPPSAPAPAPQVSPAELERVAKANAEKASAPAPVVPAAELGVDVAVHRPVLAVLAGGEGTELAPAAPAAMGG